MHATSLQHSNLAHVYLQHNASMSKNGVPLIKRHGRTTAVDHHADLQVLKRIRKYLLPKDFEISTKLLQEMSAGYDIGDPVVDRLTMANIKFVKPLQSTILNRHNSFTNLDSKLQNSSDFIELYNQFSAHPQWFDVNLARRGAIAYRRYPLMLIWLLRNVALMAGYSIPALSLPLIRTGALVHEALPRLMRTYAYILAVSEHSELTGADAVLAVGGEGWRQSITVRQIHSLVRQKLLNEGWDSEYWGVPVNQTDMIATHLQFSLLIMRGLKLLGARISKEEARGILHLWHLASWWMGIELKRLPNTEAECWEWLYTYLATQYLDFKVGRPLAKALHDLPSQIMGEENRKGKFVEQVNASVTRTLVGDDIGDGLGLPKSKLRYSVLASVPILYTIDSARRLHPHFDKKIETFRQQRQNNMNWWLKQNDSYYK